MTSDIEEFYKTATEAQKDLLSKIADGSVEEGKLVERIKGIGKAKQPGDLVPGCHTVFADVSDDDKIVRAMGPLKQLEDVRREMGAYMKRAVELGMGHLGLIQRGYKAYTGKPLSQ